MRLIEDFISPLVEQQFPEFYQEEGQPFIAFVKAYYEWAEKNLQLITLENPTNFLKGDVITQGERTGTVTAIFNDYYLVELNQEEIFKCNTFCNELTLASSSSGGLSFISTVRQFNHEFLARNLPNYRDIDRTIDKFIIQFKNKYLPDIQFNTESNKRLFIKNALDFYRAKGTERAVDLFFKLIYGLEAQVYYPGDDLFRLSDNEFIQIQYLEVVPNEKNVQFVGSIVNGYTSGAIAFVDRLIRVKKGARYIEVLHLSNVSGNFSTGEEIYTDTLEINVLTKVLGSLSSAEVVATDAGFTLGETLAIQDGEGKKGKVRVEETGDFVGIVNFELLNGGWGYTANAEILGSDRVFLANNVVVENTRYHYFIDPLKQFETIRQDLITFIANTANSDYVVGDTLTGEDASNTITIVGDVVSINNDSGVIVLNYDPGTYSNDSLIETTVELYQDSNSVSIAVSNISFTHATANVIGCSSNLNIEYTGSTVLSAGDSVYQKDENDLEIANGVITSVQNDLIGLSNIAAIERNIGAFRSDKTLYRRIDSEAFTITRMYGISAGVIDVVNTFYPTANTYGEETLTHFVGSSFSFDTKATFDITGLDNTVVYDNFYSSDIIDSIDLANTSIDSNDYGLTGNTSLGFTDIIGDATTFDSVELGSIDRIVVTNPGLRYPINPFYVIYEPKSYHLERYDYVLQYSGVERNYRNNEIIVGNTSGARGIITRHERERRTLYVTRISLADDLSTSEDFISGETITSLTSNITSTLSYVNERRKEPRTGLNADVSSTTFSGNGFITAVKVIDSGFGYFQDEIVSVQSENNSNKEATLRLSLGKQGVAPGYFNSRKGFLSSDKYLHDNDFYQEYSYQVLTSLPFEVYKRTLIDVLHVSGTKPFGKYVATSINRLNIAVTTEASDFEIGRIDLFVNENTFFDHRIAITFRPDTFIDADNFFGSTVTGGIIRPLVLNNEQSFETAQLFSTIRPNILNNNQTFFASVVRSKLSVNTFNNTQTFFGLTVDEGIIRPSLAINSSEFYTLNVSKNQYVEDGYIAVGYVSELGA